MGARSMPTSLPLRFITLPAMNTVSTLLVSIAVTIAPKALLKGSVLGRSVRRITMSASLPGVRVPIFESSPGASVPCTVATSLTSRAVSSVGTSCSPLIARSLMSARYVVNAGGTPNISGFIIDPLGGHLVPLPNSQRPLAGGTLAMPGDISFNADGCVLLVSEKGTKLIDTYRVDFRGYASGPLSHASSGVTPFGFSVTNRGYAILSEAGSGAASSYEIDHIADLELVSGSVALGQNAPCWLVTTRDGRYAYTANAPAAGRLAALASRLTACSACSIPWPVPWRLRSISPSPGTAR